MEKYMDKMMKEYPNDPVLRFLPLHPGSKKAIRK